MDKIRLELKNASQFVNKEDLQEFIDKSDYYRDNLIHGTGSGSDYIGWVELPTQTHENLINRIETIAKNFKDTVEVIVVIGIGGSYLGAKAVIDAILHNFDMLMSNNNNPVIIYAGNNINEDYLAELEEVLDTVSFGICVISKSGTTTEPAIAFRILKNILEKQVGTEEAANRIVAITDKSKGALLTLSKQKGYNKLIIPDNVGGRYSVLTPVGLLPIACAGLNINKLIQGAKDMQKDLLLKSYDDNIAMQYAAIRNALYKGGKKIEVLVNYNPKLINMAEWWRQLYGESEGKDGKGIFPTSVSFTTDLHSMGQYIQDGERIMFETVLSVENTNKRLIIPNSEDNLDNLNYLQGRYLDSINKSAELATTIAHVSGGVPNIRIIIPKLNEYYLGQLIYFFELACGISGYMLDVNPFNQPGVETYKKNMFALLGRPGFETETNSINNKLDK